MIASGYQIVVRQKADRRPSLADLWNEVFPLGFSRNRTLTEISGDSGIGKTTLLHHIVAKAAAPKERGGKSCKVIYIDGNHKSHVGHFKKCVRNMLANNTSCNVVATLSDDEVLLNILKSVIYLPCYSAGQFDLALEDIEDLLWDHEDVALLAIDGLDAFYWEDCYNRLLRMSTHYKKLSQRIKTLCQEHNICCMFTVDSNYLQSKCKRASNIFNPLVDYKLHLHMESNGERYLNNKPFYIVDGLMHFSKNI